MRPTLWIAVSGLVVGLVSGSSAAAAHSRLDRAEPAPGATVASSPSEVRIWTTQELMLRGTGLTVTDENGNQVDNGDSHVDQNDPDRKQIVATLPPLPDGTYTVNYSTLSADDGHDFTDSYTFTVSAGSAQSPEPMDPGEGMSGG